MDEIELIQDNMGMYSELIFGARFKAETPTHVIEKIAYMIDPSNKMPKGDLFLNANGFNPLNGTSVYFGGGQFAALQYDESFKAWSLNSRANIQNNGEIESFLKWISPHIESGSGLREMYAIVIYEESEVPTIYYKDSTDAEPKEGVIGIGWLESLKNKIKNIFN